MDLLLRVAELFGVTFLAAWAGGWAAFRAERKSRLDNERKGQISAANRAIFAIAQIYMVYGNLRDFFLPDAHLRQDPDRALKVNSPQPGMLSDIRFNFDELSFLLDMEGDHDVSALMELMLLEWRYRVLVVTTNSRATAVDDLHKTMAQRRLANLPPGGGAVFYAQEHAKATALTDQLTELIEDGLKYTKEVNAKLQTTLKRQFPNQSFLQVNFQ